jgi:hypothetical protein
MIIDVAKSPAADFFSTIRELQIQIEDLDSRLGSPAVVENVQIYAREFFRRR